MDVVEVVEMAGEVEDVAGAPPERENGIIVICLSYEATTANLGPLEKTCYINVSIDCSAATIPFQFPADYEHPLTT